MSARDVIAEAVYSPPSGLGPCLYDAGDAPYLVRDETDRVVFQSPDRDAAEERWKAECRRYTGDRILSALTAAGYRIVPPGGLDAASVERCAKELADAAFAIEEDERDWRSWNGPDPRGHGAADRNLATARLLRAKAAALRSLIEEPTNDAR